MVEVATFHHNGKLSDIVNVLTYRLASTPRRSAGLEFVSLPRASSSAFALASAAACATLQSTDGPTPSHQTAPQAMLFPNNVSIRTFGAPQALLRACAVPLLQLPPLPPTFAACGAEEKASRLTRWPIIRSYHIDAKRHALSSLLLALKLGMAELSC